MTKFKFNTYLKMQKSILRTFLVAGLCLTGLCISAIAQPSFNGISQEEALRQANELLRQHGIDPTGSDPAAEDSHAAGDGNDPSTTQTLPNLPQPVENRPASTPLTLEMIRDDADVWPAKVLILEELHFHGGLTLTPGNLVDFRGFHDAENVLVSYREHNLFIPANFTDVIERSNRIASGHAKAEGYRGRVLEQLDSILVTLSGDEMRRTSSDVLAGADLFLFYISSDACGWCRQFTPKLVKAMQKVERNFPGRIQLIHASVDRNLSEFRSQYIKSGAQAAIPPTDRRWFLDAFSALHPNVTQIPQPSLMLLNANGRLIDSAARDNRNTVAIESLLERLAQHAANASTLRPQWMQLTAPLALADNTSKPAAALQASAAPSVPNTDPTIAGPEPYPATLRDGTAVPGVVLYDKRASGSRIPALTLQQFPREDGTAGHYYVLAFRQIQGKTFGGGQPLLTAWMHTTTRDGALADSDLADRVADYRQLHEKFLRWRETAVANQVSDFQKVIYTLPQTYVDSRHLRPAISIPGANNAAPDALDVNFVVQSDPARATLKTETIMLMPDAIDAFTRLIPQVDSLVAALSQEQLRLAQERAESIRELQDVESLFD